jgi:hypothetical protein
MSAFAKTLAAFCGELRLTFPELGAHIDRAATLTANKFWNGWQNNLIILMERDAVKLQEVRRGLLVGPVCLTPALWSEISEATRTAIWRYLRTLVLEAAMEISLDSVDAEKTSILMGILTEERLTAGGVEAEEETADLLESATSHLKPLFERLKGIMGSAEDLSGLADMPMPEIPERLRNGRIAKLAEEMAKQFKPEEFGIDPKMLEGDNVEEILKRLAELYQRDPTLLMTGAKRVAERIKKQILGGSLNRDELIAEAREYVEIFKEHPLFKEAIDKFQGLVGAADMFGGGSTGAPSERLRAVQERLRRKMAARGSTKNSVPGK